MQRIRPPSVETRKVLACLATASGAWVHGYDIMKATGLKSGSLYPILMRLEARGFLEAVWQEPTRPGRPARHGYRLSAEGRRLWLALQAPDPVTEHALGPLATPGSAGLAP